MIMISKPFELGIENFNSKSTPFYVKFSEFTIHSELLEPILQLSSIRSAERARQSSCKEAREKGKKISHLYFWESNFLRS